MMEYVLQRAVPESVLEHPMFSLDPRKDWVRGRVALVGDSAHVMPPNLSQARKPSLLPSAICHMLPAVCYCALWGAL